MAEAYASLITGVPGWNRIAILVDEDQAYSGDLARRITSSVSARGGEVIYHGTVAANSTWANADQALVHAKSLVAIGARLMFIESVSILCVRAIMKALEAEGATGEGFAFILGVAANVFDISGTTVMHGGIAIAQAEGRQTDLGFSGKPAEYMEVVNMYDAFQVLTRSVAPYFKRLDGGYATYMSSDGGLDGAITCPCLEAFKVFHALNTSGYVDGNGNIVLEGVSQPLYPADRNGRKIGAVYGGGSCMSHDQQLPPSCADATGIPLANAPAWCLASWCFVDTASCDRANTLSRYFPAAKLMYSYDTCGSEDLYSKVSNTWNPIPNEKRMQARLQAMSIARTSRLDASVAASGSVAFEPGSNDRESLGFMYEIVNLRKSSHNSPTTRAVVGRMERGEVAFTAQVIWPGNTTARPADRSSSTVPPTIVINLVGKGDNQTDLVLKLAVAQQAADEINANLELLPSSRLVISSTKDLSSDYTPADLEAAVLGRLAFSTPVAPVVALVTTTSSVSKNALVSKKFTLPTIGIFATSPSLSNAADYPFFSRVIPSDESMSLALIKTMHQLEWTRFFFLYKCSSGWGKANEAMLASDAAKWGMKMGSACLDSSSDAATNTTADAALQKAAQGLYTIIIPFFSTKYLLAFLRRGVDTKLLDRKRGHQFVFGTSTTEEKN